MTLKWKLLLHGQPKIGKTSLLETTLGPRLLIDTEAGTDWVNEPYVRLDELNGKPPDGVDDPKTTSIYRLTDPFRLDSVLDWVLKGDTPYRSVSLDSVTDWQEQMKTHLFGPGHAMEVQDWGTLYSKCAGPLNKLRLDIPARTDVAQIVVCALSRPDSTDKPVIAVEGKLQRILAQHMDTVGYLCAGTMAQDGTIPRQTLIAPLGGVYAGDRTRKLPRLYPDGAIPHVLQTETGEITNDLTSIYNQLTQ